MSLELRKERLFRYILLVFRQIEGVGKLSPKPIDIDHPGRLLGVVEAFKLTFGARSLSTTNSTLRRRPPPLVSWIVARSRFASFLIGQLSLLGLQGCCWTREGTPCTMGHLKMTQR